MVDKFSVVDPLGRTVTCDLSRWMDHVLKRRRWDEEAGWEVVVIKAIRQPLMICRDSGSPETKICYYYTPSVTTKYMVVYVEFLHDDKKGELVTAIEKHKGKSGEVLLWPFSKT